jgi:rare lipoprotein A
VDIARLWYYRPVRKLSFVICALIALAGCGHKKVKVQAPPTTSIPQTSRISNNELEGIASYYAEPYHGRRTANGEVFDTYEAMTAAHRTLPFNTLVRVTNKNNGREVDVRINDRGPFIDGRVIDLSLRAAREIDMVRAGVVPVKLKILKEAEAAKEALARPAAYAVQVAAFENPDAAEGLKKILEKKYSGVSIQSVDIDRTFYRVRIGQPDLDRANKIAAELRKEDFKPIVVRLN